MSNKKWKIGQIYVAFSEYLALIKVVHISSLRNSMIKKKYLDAPQFLASKKGDDASPRHELEQIGHLQDAPSKNGAKCENHCCP